MIALQSEDGDPRGKDSPNVLRELAGKMVEKIEAGQIPHVAEAAVLHENLIAVQSQSYGPEARGGATRCDVIIAESAIHFPKVIQPNVLICLTQQSYANFFSLLRPGGLLITDTRYVRLGKKVDARQVELPMYETVMQKIGKPIVFNICMLGVVLGLTQLVRPESIMKVLETQIPASFLDMNRQALELGLKLSEGLGD